MRKPKACKNCKMIVEGDTCPICKGNQLVENWKGKIIILDPEKSEIAKKLNIKQKGSFALKTK